MHCVLYRGNGSQARLKPFEALRVSDRPHELHAACTCGHWVGPVVNRHHDRYQGSDSNTYNTGSVKDHPVKDRTDVSCNNDRSELHIVGCGLRYVTLFPTQIRLVLHKRRWLHDDDVYAVTLRSHNPRVQNRKKDSPRRGLRDVDVSHTKYESIKNRYAPKTQKENEFRNGRGRGNPPVLMQGYSTTQTVFFKSVV